MAADHTRMEDFLEIAGTLVIAGCRGTDKDWAILGWKKKFETDENNSEQF